jgi:hypothetical protein
VTLETKRTANALEGVPAYDAGSESFSDIRALSAALRFLGEEVDPGLLMVITGEAFRGVMHADRFCLASAYVTPEPVLAVGARAFGYQPRYLLGAGLDETWMVLSDAIDAGQPALSAGIACRDDIALSTWWFLVRGYEAQARTVVVSGFLTGGEEFRPLPALHGRKATWTGVVRGLSLAPTVWAERPVFILGRKLKTPAPAALVAEVLERAVRLSREGSVVVPAAVPAAAGRYVLGLASYQAWADRLAALTGQEAFFHRPPLDGPSASIHVTDANREQGERVREGRRAAATYLRRFADVLSAPAHDALLSAAAGYADVADLADEFVHLFADLNPVRERDRLADRDNRRAGVVLLRQMGALEAAAVVQLDAARRCAAQTPATH